MEKAVGEQSRVVWHRVDHTIVSVVVYSVFTYFVVGAWRVQADPLTVSLKEISAYGTFCGVFQMDGSNAVGNMIAAYCAVDRVLYSDSIHRGLSHCTINRVFNHASVDCVVEFDVMTGMVYPVASDGNVFCSVNVNAVSGPAITTVSN